MLLEIYLGQMQAIMYFVEYEIMQHYFIVPDHCYNQNSHTHITDHHWDHK